MPSVVALADVDIENMALSHIGVSQTITGPTDQSAAAQVCGFWYPKMRNWLLQSAPWNFAYTDTLLTADGPNTLPGWAYAYQYPNDCLQPIAVTTQSGQRLGPVFWCNYWRPYPPQNFAVPKIPFKVIESQNNAGELAIQCDILATSGAPLYLFYIQCVTNTAMFDPMFIDTLSLYVAARVGKILRADLQKVQAAAQEANAMRLQALAQHLNAAQQDLERDSPSILARW